MQTSWPETEGLDLIAYQNRIGYAGALKGLRQSARTYRAVEDRGLVEDRGDVLATRIAADDDELLVVLKQTFGLQFPAGTRFRHRHTS